jgi:hypothetical protein
MPIDFPSNPTNGQVYSNWIFDSSITAWRNVNTDTGIGTLNAMGLKNVVPTSVAVGSGSATTNANGTVTFSGATGIRLNGVFTSTYRNYKVVLDATVASAIQSIYIRYSSGGTDSTTTDNYGAWGRSRENSTAANGGTIGANYGFLVDTSTSTGVAASIDIFKPQIADATRYLANTFGFDSASYVGYVGGIKTGATSFDGINLLTASGATISGTVQVYGYTN